jgi:hypothetical protein
VTLAAARGGLAEAPPNPGNQIMHGWASHDRPAEPANADRGLRIARENSVADQLSIHRTPNFRPAMTGVAEPFLFRRVTKRSSKGMDITEYVKRNNFAVAQYEPKSCCAAQNPRLSNDAPLLAVGRPLNESGIRVPF